jgi:hypothetical protein
MFKTTDPFYYMGDEAGSERPLVPATAETQVREFTTAFETEVAKPFSPTVGIHGLVFGEWGHGKTQVLYRLRRRLASQHNMCLPLLVVPELLSPWHLLQAAAFEAETRGLEFRPLTEAAIELNGVDPQESRVAVRAAEAFAQFGSAAGRPHIALLFDEAQTLTGVSFQDFLRNLQVAFQQKRVGLHTVQCHSLVTLDRALQLVQELDWLSGPALRKIHLPSLRDEEAHDLFRSRLATIAPEKANTFISDGIARTICRLVGGNPREMLKLAGELWREVGSADRASGVDLLRVCKRWETGPGGQTLFIPHRLKRLTDLLPQVWQADLGARMARYLETHIGTLFGEDARIEIAVFADGLDANIDIIEKNLRRHIDGIRLLDVVEDDLGSSVRLSLDARRYFSSSALHGGDFDEKQAQFDTLIAPTSQQHRLADALRFTELGQVTPVRLGAYPDQSPIRGYELTFQVPDSSYHGKVLVTAMLGVHWACEAALELAKGLSAGRWACAIVLDLVVGETWQAWLDECASRNVRLALRGEPRIALPITADDWANILPPPVESADAPGVRAALLCAALQGAEHARRNQIEPTQTQAQARSGTILLVRNALPTADQYCYLPTDEERAWLDLPLWSSGPVDLSSLREHLSKPALTAAQLRDLVPHYLQSVGSRRWTRLPSDRQLLSKTVLDILRKNPDVQVLRLQELLRAKVTFPHPERLGPCSEWVLDKLAAEGFVTRDLLSVQYRDVGKEIREIRLTVKKRQKELETSLARLRSLSEQQWQGVRATASRVREAARKESIERGTGLTAFATLQNLDQQLREVIAGVEARLSNSHKQLQTLETELLAWLTERRARVEQIHADWRELLGLTVALEQLDQAAGTVSKLTHLADSDADQDRVGAAELAYQRGAVRKEQIDYVLQHGWGTDALMRKLSITVLSGTFKELVVSFVE